MNDERLVPALNRSGSLFTKKKIAKCVIQLFLKRIEGRAVSGENHLPEVAVELLCWLLF